MPATRTTTQTFESLRQFAANLETDTRDLERQLAQDDFDGSEDARARLSEARRHLRWAAADLELAQTQYGEETPDDER